MAPAVGGQGLGDQFLAVAVFVHAQRVGVGRVDDGHPGVERRVDGGDRPGPVGPAFDGERHLTQTDRAHRPVADWTLLHVGTSSLGCRRRLRGQHLRDGHRRYRRPRPACTGGGHAAESEVGRKVHARWLGRWRHDMEGDPVDGGLVVDGTAWAARRRSVSRLGLARPADVGLGDGREGDQVHAVHLDLDPAHPVAAAHFDLPPTPQAEGEGDVARCDVVVQLLAELHRRPG